MKWLGAAFAGWAIGTITFLAVWTVLVAKIAKLPIDREFPSWPIKWAMSAAFIVVSLAWAGLFKGIVPVDAFSTYYD